MKECIKKFRDIDSNIISIQIKTRMILDLLINIPMIARIKIINGRKFKFVNIILTPDRL